MLIPPASGDDWLGLTDADLPVGVALDWAGLPSCGAVVLFSGNVRDHAPGRNGVESLEYEAYEEHVVPRLADIAAGMRSTWPTLGRVVLLHRIGVVPVGTSSVVVVVAGVSARDLAIDLGTANTLVYARGRGHRI
jgi:molybdopterin synthase catalytic subunit